MRFELAFGSGLLLAGGSVAAPASDNTASQSFNPSNATLQQINDYALSVAKARIPANSTTCTKDKLAVRKYWYALESRLIISSNRSEG